MKRAYFFLVAMPLLSACVVESNEPISLGEMLEITATHASPELKSGVIDGGTNVYWDTEEEISVFTSMDSAKFTSTNTELSRTVTFIGEINYSSGQSIWALYPYREDATCIDGLIHSTLPARQEGREGSFAKNTNITVAKSNSLNMTFYNVCGGVRFSLINEGVKMVSFEGNNEEALAGDFSVAFDGNAPSVTVSAKGSSYISLTAPDGGTFVPGKWYYISAFPVELSKGFKMSFYKDDSMASRISSQKVSIVRGIFGSLSEADRGVAFSSEELLEQKDETSSSISEIVDSCISEDFDARDLIETHSEEILSLPCVSDINIGNDAAKVSFFDGTGAVYTYDPGSIFEYEESEFSAASIPYEENKEKSIHFETKANSSNRDCKIKKVAVFNLFSNSSDRKNQNALVDDFIKIMKDAGSEVDPFDFEAFTEENVKETLLRGNYDFIYISTLGGDDSGKNIAVGGALWKEQRDKWGYPDPIVQKGVRYRYMNIVEIIDKMNSKKHNIVYLASCNTLKNDFKYNNTAVLGWNGVNVVGQAYGVMLADYLVNEHRTLLTFYKAFGFNGNGIQDPDSKANLIWSGKLEDYLPYPSSYTKTFDEQCKYLDIKNPRNGCYIHNILTHMGLSTSYKVNSVFLNPERTPIKLPWKTEFKNSNGESMRFRYRFDDLRGNVTDTKPLHISSEYINELKWSGFRPGVWKISSMVEEDDLLGSYYRDDVTYAVFAKGFVKNDGETMESIGDPNVVTFDPISDEEQVLANGAVVDMEPEGFRLGFILKEISTGKETDFPAELIGNSAVFYASLTGLKKGSSYSVQAYAVDKDGHKTSGNKTDFVSPIDVGDIIQTGEYVDLGLPSGLKWATCNLGASMPEEYGDYFAWGETKPKSTYDWKTYKYCNGTSNTLTKYCDSSDYGSNVDNKEILDLEDDAAYINLGKYWRTPSEPEWAELISYCTFDFITQNGVFGVKITSNIDGYRDRNIFLPAAGNYQGDNLIFAGEDCLYLSSSLYSPSYRHLIFGCGVSGQSGVGEPLTYYDERYFGQTVRPVYDEKSDYDSKIVDLGLPSGTLWAKYNIGASSEMEYGDFFAFGENETKNYFSSENYSGTYDNRDVAKAVWGGDWTVPCGEQFYELFDNITSVEDVTQGDFRGIKLFGPSGNFIILPYAGCEIGTRIKYRGTQAVFWSIDGNYFWYGLEDWVDKTDPLNIEPYMGLCIRPVIPGKNNTKSNCSIKANSLRQNAHNMHYGGSANEH